jgi:hypothetical protein
MTNRREGPLVFPNPRVKITGCGGSAVLALAAVPLRNSVGEPPDDDRVAPRPSSGLLMSAPTRPNASGWSATSAFSSQEALP